MVFLSPWQLSRQEEGSKSKVYLSAKQPYGPPSSKQVQLWLTSQCFNPKTKSDTLWYLRQHLLLAFKNVKFYKLAGQWVPGIHLFLPSQGWDYNFGLPCQGCFFVLCRPPTTNKTTTEHSSLWPVVSILYIQMEPSKLFI